VKKIAEFKLGYKTFQNSNSSSTLSHYFISKFGIIC